jgi:hypothetical protein
MPGSLSKKLQKLRELGAISVRLDQDEKTLLEGSAKVAIAYDGAVSIWAKDLLTRTLNMCCERIIGSEDWPNLADDPSKFTKELERYLTVIRSCMKLLYDIPDHRPSLNDERDRQIFAIKQKQLQWSFGQVAREYNRISGVAPVDQNLVERSYKRVVERIVQDVQAIRKTAQDYVSKANLTAEALMNSLPTPEQVMDILDK